MTDRKTHPSPLSRARRRSEFTTFYRTTYPVVAGELLALTGQPDLARAVAGVSYARAWQAWPAVRNLVWPEMWVRADAVRRVHRPVRAQRLLEHGLPQVRPVSLDPEDEVLVAGLQLLPEAQRLPLVLHFMGQVPVDTIVEWFGGTVDGVDAQLDNAFSALLDVLDWSDDGAAEQTDSVGDADTDAGEDDPDENALLHAPRTADHSDDAYAWTAEALEESAHRLQHGLPTPPTALVFRRATARKVARRGAPATAAAAAACIGLVVYFSPASPATAQPAVFTVTPPPSVQLPPPVDPDEPTPATPTPPDSTTVAPATNAATTPSHLAAAAARTTTPPATTTSPAGTTTSASATTTTPTTSTTTTSPPTTTPTTSTTSTTSTTASESGGSESGGSDDNGTGSGNSGSTVTTTTPGTSSSDETSSSQTSTSDETSSSETDTTTTQPSKHKHKHKGGSTSTTTTTTTTGTDADTGSGGTGSGGTAGSGGPGSDDGGASPIVVTPPATPTTDPSSATGSAPSQGTVIVGNTGGGNRVVVDTSVGGSSGE